MSTIVSNAKQIFLEAVENHEPDRWPEFLADTCGSDSALLQQVEVLLEAYRRPSELLDGAGPLATLDLPSVAERPGTVIGTYKLLHQIGEGGFGVVFMAEQERPVKRRVALKVIKPGMDSQKVIARFEAERQALAMMEHPNIAKVHDAGATENGRPYFVMELVQGVAITDYCDQCNLITRERLELFITVCQAVQHAHQKGVIHRDIKPTNVLVAMQDGRPAPKIIDFGVAKAINQQLSEHTLTTAFAQMIGTPIYMSPEQAELSPLGADTRSDIYALGVLLYELLTGTTPLDKDRLHAASYDELRRIIREEDPPRPSTRISTLDAKLATTVAEHRRTDARQLRQSVCGELDWIVMKSLEKDRTRRYETANSLARDVRRYLDDEPVVACPPSRAYRLRKFMRRNKGPVLSAFLVLLVLVGGIIGTTLGMIRAEKSRQNAVSAEFAEAQRAEGERVAKEETQKRLAQVEKATEILAAVFRDLDPVAAEKEGVELRALLARRMNDAAQQLEGEAVGDPLVVAGLQHVLGISLRELGHLEQAERVLVKACQTRERLLSSDHLDTVATKHDLALLYRDQGKYDLAIALQEQVVAVRTAKLGLDHPDTLTSQHNLAVFYFNQEKYAQAKTLFKKVIEVRTSTQGADHPDTLTSQHRLALLYRRQGKYELAEALYNEVLALRTAKLGPNHLDTVATKDSLAALEVAQGHTDLAEALCKEVLTVRTAKLGPDHPDTIYSQHHLASLYLAQGKTDLAETLIKEVIASRTAKLGADHPDTLRSRTELAVVYFRQGNYALAEMQYKDVLAIRSSKLGANHRDTLDSQSGLAIVYRCMKKPEQAIPLLEDAIERSRANNYPVTIGMQAELGAVYCDDSRFADSIALLEEILEKSRENPELDWVGNVLLTAYVGSGKKADVVALATQQARTAHEQLPANSLELAVALAPPGQALMEVEEYADAEPLLVANYEGLKQKEAQIPPEEKDALLRDAATRLVQLYDAWGKPEQAAKWRKELATRPADT